MLSRKIVVFGLSLLAIFLVTAASVATKNLQANTSGVLAPVANFTASHTSTTPGQVITFNAGSSVDAWGARQLEYRWDYNSSFKWTAWSASPVTTAKFTQDGQYVVRLQVRDRTGRVDETKTFVRIQALGGGAPIGQFVADPTKGSVNTNFKFAVTMLASRIGTQNQDLSVRWDWEGDGKWDTEWSSSRLFFHTFPESGSKEVRLEIRDANGLTSVEKGFYVTGKENDSFREKEIGRIDVTNDASPQASLRTWPTRGGVGTIVHFDAAGSLRAQDYRFDFEGDGVWDTRFGGSLTEHRYDQPGIFNPVVEARSAGQGWSDTATRQITIEDDRNPLAPIAKLTAHNLTNNLKGGDAADDAVLGVLLDEIAFSAAGSTDPDGGSAALTARWDYEGDGRWDTPFATAKDARHRYTSEGTFHPTVEILDASGYRVQARLTVAIVKNTPPTARLTSDLKLGTRKTTFRFDAGGSTDDQSATSQLLARFDWEGDGTYDTQFSTTKTASHVYSKVARYQPAVQIRDHAGQLAVAKTNLEIVDPSPPVAAFSFAPSVGTFATNFKFDGSKSTDPSGVGGPFSYRWDFHAGETNDVQYDTGWQTQPTASVRYTTTGWQGVRLSVRNRDGVAREFYQKVFVHPASKYIALLAKSGALTDADPERLITRAELAKMLVKTAGGRSTVRPVSGQFFTDVDGKAWYAPFAATAVQRGWLPTRGNFEFDPAGGVTRVELARAAIAALYPRVAVGAPAGPNFRAPFTDVPADARDLRFATVVKDDGLLLDDPLVFNFKKPVTRAEAAVMLGKLLEKYNVPSLRVAYRAVDLVNQLTARILSVAE